MKTRSALSVATQTVEVKHEESEAKEMNKGAGGEGKEKKCIFV